MFDGKVAGYGPKRPQNSGIVLSVHLLFMKRHGHDTISRVKRLLDTISVMNINVNVKNSLVKPQ
jgi:hypothetical protein